MQIIRDEFENRVVFKDRIPDAITEVTTDALHDAGMDDDWLKFTIAYMGKLPDDVTASDASLILSSSVEMDENGFLDASLRDNCAREIADKWMNQRWLERSMSALVDASKEREFSKIQILSPSVLDSSASKNLITPAMTAVLLYKIIMNNKQDAPEKHINNGLHVGGLPVTIPPISEAAPHIAIKGARGTIKSSSNDEADNLKEKYIGNKLGKQIVVDGHVEEDTLYWLIDDGITYGSSLRAYLDHIDGYGGTVGAISTLSRRFVGSEVIHPEYSTHRFLQKVIDDLHVEPKDRQKGFMGGTRVESSIDFAMNLVGISLGLGDYAKATATNQEMLAVGAYFMNPENTTHQEYLNTALADIGTSTAKSPDSYIVQLSALPAGNVEEFRELLHNGEEHRTMWSRPSYLPPEWAYDEF